MDRLKTTDNGGFPLRLDDFRWMLGQASNHGIYEALNNMLRGFGDNFVVQGCTVSGTSPNVAITEGWIMLSGELLKVDAQSSINTTTDNTFVKQTTFDAAGNKTFQDLSTNDTYQKDRGVVSGTGGTLAHDGVSLNDLLGLSEWTVIDLQGSTDVKQNDSGIAAGSDQALVQAPQAGSYLRYKIMGKTIQCSFRIVNIQTTKNSTHNAVSIYIDNLPFTFKSVIQQRTTYDANCTNRVDALSGTHRALMQPGSDKLIFQIMSTQGSLGAFNLEYELQTSPSKNVQSTGADNNVNWDMAGNFTAELD